MAAVQVTGEFFTMTSAARLREERMSSGRSHLQRLLLSPPRTLPGSIDIAVKGDPYPGASRIDSVRYFPESGSKPQIVFRKTEFAVEVWRDVLRDVHCKVFNTLGN
jgi:hypothetical protein